MHQRQSLASLTLYTNPFTRSLDESLRWQSRLRRFAGKPDLRSGQFWPCRGSLRTRRERQALTWTALIAAELLDQMD